MQIAEAAIAAAHQDDALARLNQIGQDGLLVLVQHLGAHRHLHHDIVALAAGLVAALAVMALLGLEMLLIAVIDQGVQIGHAFQDDVATASAITAIGTAELDMLLAPEATGSGSAVAAFHENLGLIEKLHFVCLSSCHPEQAKRSEGSFRQGRRPSEGEGSFASLRMTRGTRKTKRGNGEPFPLPKIASVRERPYSAASGRGSTTTKVRPSALCLKATLPAALANRV